MNNDCHLFPQCQLAKPGPALQDRYEVEKVIEYCRAPRTSISQYKVRWLGYSLEDDQSIDAKDISAGMLQEFCTNGSWENIFKGHCTNNGCTGRCHSDETLAMIQKERERVLNLPAEEEAEISTKANYIREQIFDLCLQY